MTHILFHETGTGVHWTGRYSLFSSLVILLKFKFLYVFIIYFSPSKDKATKVETTSAGGTPSGKSRQQQQQQQQPGNDKQQQMQQPVPAQVPPGVWTTNPSMFVGVPAQAYRGYQNQNGVPPKPGYANGAPIGRHFTSEPSLNQSKFLLDVRTHVCTYLS